MSIIQSFINQLRPREATIQVWPIFEYFRDHHGKKFIEAEERALHKFFPHNHILVPLDWPERERADNRFWDFFFFDYRDRSFRKKTILEFYCENADLSESERDYYKNLIKNQVYSAFRVIKIDTGKSFNARDLLTNKTYLIKEYTATFEMNMWDLIIWRITTDKKWDYRLAPWMCNVYSWEAAISIWNVIERNNDKWEYDKFSSLIFEKIFYKKSEKDELNIFNQQDGNDDKEFLQREFEKTLKKYKSILTIDEIIDWIYNESEWYDVWAILTTILKSFRKHPSEKQIDDFMQLCNKFLNKLPRKALWWKSPNEASDDINKWQIEKTLIQDLSNALQSSIDLNRMPSEKVANKFIEDFQKNWLDTSQEVLGGETPREAILKERKSLWNKDKRISIRFMANRVWPWWINENDKTISIENINVSDNYLLHDLKVLLKFIDQKDWIKLNPKSNDIRLDILEKIISKCKKTWLFYYKYWRKWKSDFSIWNYSNFLWLLWILAKLIIKKWQELTINKDNYAKFLKLSWWEQLYQLFTVWYFSNKWDFLFNRPLNSLEKDILEGYYIKRESALANLDLIWDKKESMKDFFYRFYWSKRNILKNDNHMKLFLKWMLTTFVVNNFNIFWLLDWYVNKYAFENWDFYTAIPEYIQTTTTGRQLLPHIVDELFLKKMDQWSQRWEFSPVQIWEYDPNRNKKSLVVNKTGRNDPCPCWSWKKYKKCCLK